MQHRIDALFTFLASQYTDSQIECDMLLSASNFDRASKVYETTPETLKLHIYEAFLDFGIETADGMFRMGFVPDYLN